MLGARGARRRATLGWIGLVLVWFWFRFGLVQEFDFFVGCAWRAAPSDAWVDWSGFGLLLVDL